MFIVGNNSDLVKSYILSIPSNVLEPSPVLKISLSSSSQLYPYTHFSVGSDCFIFNSFVNVTHNLIVEDKYKSCQECSISETNTPTPTPTITPSVTITKSVTPTKTIPNTPTPTATVQRTTYVAKNCCNNSIDINVEAPINPKKYLYFTMEQ